MSQRLQEVIITGLVGFFICLFVATVAGAILMGDHLETKKVKACIATGKDWYKPAGRANYICADRGNDNLSGGSRSEGTE